VLSLASAAAFALPSLSLAVEKATVTKVENRVNYGEFTQKGTRPVAAKDIIGANNYLLSEANSRAELQYDDGSLVRIGQHTVFSFNPSARVLSLDRGNLLFHIPKGGGGTIKTGSFTAAITGTAGILWPNAIAILNGSVRLGPGGQVVRSGQIASRNRDGSFSIKPFSASLALGTGLLYFNGPMPGIDAVFLVKDHPASPLLDGMPELPRSVAAALRAEVAASPANLNQIVERYLRKYPAQAGSVIEHALQGISPRDVPKTAALGRTAVELIYNELPGARNEVKWVVFALVDGLRDDGSTCPDPYFTSQVASAVLPAILKNDPAAAPVIVKGLANWCPNLAPLLAELERQLNSPLSFGLALNPSEPAAVLPNVIRVEAPTQPAATQFAVP
jgi:hypothetical protein